MKITEKINVDFRGGNYTYSIPEDYRYGITIDSSLTEWLSTDTTNGVVTIDVDENSDTETRVGYITIKSTSADGEEKFNCILEIRQYCEFIPVCSDTFYNSDLGNFKYTIRTDEDGVIYNGNATSMPNSGIEVCINKLCYPYLSSKFPIMAFEVDGMNVYDMDEYCKKFYLTNNNVDIWEYKFIDAWKRDNITTDTYGDIITSTPIKNVIDTRQYFIASALQVYGGIFRVSIDGNDVVYRYGDSGEYHSYLCAGRNGRMVDGASIILNNKIIYDVQDTCYDWCIYYKNLYGGWDSLLVNGNTVESTNYSPEMYTTSYNNLLADAEHHKYLNVANKTYKMYFSLNDEESKKVEHLFGSCEMYLHNLVDDTVVPVYCTDSKVEKKTYKNQGNHKYTYEINLKEGRDNIIK